MTDDAEQYHNAWKEVFGQEGTRKIVPGMLTELGERHSSNIFLNKRTGACISQLSVSLSETDEARFRVLLQEFLTYTERHHCDFTHILVITTAKEMINGIMLQEAYSCKH